MLKISGNNGTEGSWLSNHHPMSPTTMILTGERVFLEDIFQLPAPSQRRVMIEMTHISMFPKINSGQQIFKVPIYGSFLYHTRTMPVLGNTTRQMVWGRAVIIKCVAIFRRGHLGCMSGLVNHLQQNVLISRYELCTFVYVITRVRN